MPVCQWNWICEDLFHNFFPLYFKKLAFFDQFSKIRFLGPHFCWRRSPLGPHPTQNWVPILNKIGSPWPVGAVRTVEYTQNSRWPLCTEWWTPMRRMLKAFLLPAGCPWYICMPMTNQIIGISSRLDSNDRQFLLQGSLHHWPRQAAEAVPPLPCYNG